jgi:hypothetical protein
VGLRGDSGLRSSLRPFRYVGLINGFEISICRESSTGLREPPRKSFFVENFRARLDPDVIGVATVGRSGVGRGFN